MDSTAAAKLALSEGASLWPHSKAKSAFGAAARMALKRATPGMYIGAPLIARLRRWDRNYESGKACGEFLLKILQQLIVRSSGQSNDRACLGPRGPAEHAIYGSLGVLTENIQQGHIDSSLVHFAAPADAAPHTPTEDRPVTASFVAFRSWTEISVHSP